MILATRDFMVQCVKGSVDAGTEQIATQLMDRVLALLDTEEGSVTARVVMDSLGLDA